MKTQILLALGAVTLAAFASNAFANDVRLSPRAADSQIKVASSLTETLATTVVYAAPVSPALLSPRATDNQTKVVSGMNNDHSPYLACQKMMIGSPKAVQACTDNPAMPLCNKTVADAR